MKMFSGKPGVVLGRISLYLEKIKIKIFILYNIMMRVDNGLANSFISLRIPFKDSFKDYVPFKISTVVNNPFTPSNHRPNPLPSLHLHPSPLVTI